MVPQRGRALRYAAPPAARRPRASSARRGSADAAPAGLKHHKIQKVEDFTKDWYQRGKKVGAKVTKYRKGACTNCGAMTHKAKDCVERPRAKGAKYTGKDFKDDELVQELHLDFDGKRDQWNGYDPAMHAETIKRFNTIENERESVRKAKVHPRPRQRSFSSGCVFTPPPPCFRWRRTTPRAR